MSVGKIKLVKHLLTMFSVFLLLVSYDASPKIVRVPVQSSEYADPVFTTMSCTSYTDPEIKIIECLGVHWTKV